MAKFKITMREIRENPFRPISIMGPGLKTRTAEIEAESEAQVREFFTDAKERGMESVRGFQLVSVEATTPTGE